MSDKGHLLRVLGVVFGLAAVVGSVVGQGILRAPGIAAQASESGTVLIGLWFLGGALSLLAALPYAELGAALPSAGGIVTFTERAFGKGASVLASYAMLLMLISALANVAFVAGELLVRLGVGGGEIGPGAIATATLAVFFAINALGTRISGGAQIAFSAFKGAVLAIFVVILFAQPGAPPVPGEASIAPQGLLGYATAMLVIVGAYNGWGDVVFYGEEIEDPARALPRALFGGIIAITVLYTAVNTAILHVLTPHQMAVSDFAAGDAAAGIFGQAGDTVFTIFGVVSIAAICSLMTMTVSRIAYASARVGLLPPALERVAANGTPINAMILVVLGAAAFLWSGSYLTLASTSTALSQVMILLFALCSCQLYRREPDLPRPFRVPFFKPVMALVILFDAALLVVFIWQDPANSLLGFALVAALAAGYWLVRRMAGSKPIQE